MLPVREFAQSIGLIQAVESAPLRQKTVTHWPQTKPLKFLGNMLAVLVLENMFLRQQLIVLK